jgi:hypothetical protein
MGMVLLLCRRPLGHPLGALLLVGFVGKEGRIVKVPLRQRERLHPVMPVRDRAHLTSHPPLLLLLSLSTTGIVLDRPRCRTLRV